MFIEIEPAQRDLLIELVERRLTQLGDAGVGIAGDVHGPDFNIADQRELLEQVLQLLHEAEFDVLA